MLPNPIFTEGWLKMTALYAFIFFLTTYAVHAIIFRMLVTGPDSFTWAAFQHYRRKVIFFSAVFVAPLYEEFLITFLAYTSFLQHAQAGQEGIVLILVASFFALLHLPGDIRNQKSIFRKIMFSRLCNAQLDRFFYSLAAYFTFALTGTLWASIFLHYLYNALVVVHNFDLEDGIKYPGKYDVNRIFIRGINIGFSLFATYCFCSGFPKFYCYMIAANLVFAIGQIKR